MKKRIINLVAALLSVVWVYAQETFNVSLSFKSDEFQFVYDQNGALQISTDQYICGYGEDNTEPGLPLIPINYRIPDNYEFYDYSVEDTRSVIYNNIVIAPNQQCYPTTASISLPENTPINYTQLIYPEKNVKLVEKNDWEGNTILRFLVCPFTYDTTSKKLYISNNITLKIELVSKPANGAYRRPSNMTDVIESSTRPFTFFKDQDHVIGPSRDLPKSFFIDYVIITSTELADHFKPLALWKKQKGVNTIIQTIDDIVENYPADSPQLSIKKYLKQLYSIRHLKYALLGGDDQIVPVRGCYGKVWGAEDNSIPADLYYSCFGEPLSWDLNNDGLFAQEEDSINMNQSIFVSRVPVRTAKDVDAFVNKVIGYEKNPLRRGWNNNILMAGSRIKGVCKNDHTQSDSKGKGDNIYNNYIKKYWNGERVRLYDTFTDINQGNYIFDGPHLQEQLQKGFTFVDIINHGDTKAWGFDYTSKWYTSELASTLTNNKYTIITTNSCLTNGFDTFIDDKGILCDDPCLSESFIRNPQSGVVAYLGSSRYGWDSSDESLYASSLYDGLFYHFLFSPGIENKNYGKIVAATKQALLGLCSKYGSSRWVQLSLNPVGDPEMPIYTDTPQEIPLPFIVRSGENGDEITASVYLDSCNICAMSIGDDGAAYYKSFENVSSASFEGVKTSVTICITKQNYIPVFVVSKPEDAIKPMIFNCQANKNNDNVVVTTKTDDNAKEVKLVFSSVSGGQQIMVPINSGTTTTEVNTSKISNGIKTVSLYVHGKLVDSKEFLQ